MNIPNEIAFLLMGALFVGYVIWLANFVQRPEAAHSKAPETIDEFYNEIGLALAAALVKPREAAGARESRTGILKNVAETLDKLGVEGMRIRQKERDLLEKESQILQKLLRSPGS